MGKETSIPSFILHSLIPSLLPVILLSSFLLFLHVQDGCLVGEEVGEAQGCDGEGNINPFRNKDALGHIITERFLGKWAYDQAQKFLVRWCR